MGRPHGAGRGIARLVRLRRVAWMASRWLGRWVCERIDAFAPTPMLDTTMAMLLARSIVAATRLGLFEALADGPLEPGEVAARCGTRAEPTRKLLTALVDAGYLRRCDRAFTLAPASRRWLLRDVGGSLRDKVLFGAVEWELFDHLESFLTSGVAVDVHHTLSEPDQARYQRGMRSMASLSVDEVARVTPVPRGATRLLDIGGSHGAYAAALCRRYPALRAEILDLPDAVAQARPLLAAEGLGDRVVHRCGDATRDDLGEGRWDVVFASHLLHHFDEATNRALARRVERSLRPGGVFVVQELAHDPLLDLYFAVTSSAGTWRFEDIAAWQREARLVPLRVARFVSMPPGGQQSAVKPTSSSIPFRPVRAPTRP